MSKVRCGQKNFFFWIKFIVLEGYSLCYSFRIDIFFFQIYFPSGKKVLDLLVTVTTFFVNPNLKSEVWVLARV